MINQMKNQMKIKMTFKTIKLIKNKILVQYKNKIIKYNLIQYKRHNNNKFKILIHFQILSMVKMKLIDKFNNR